MEGANDVKGVSL